MNTPTKITVLRLILIPVMLVFFGLTYLSEYFFIAVAAIFAIASATDFVDGYLARKNNQVTDLGKFLDPIADKVLVVSALLIILGTGIFNTGGIATAVLGVIFCSVIIAREFLVGALRQVAASNNKVLAADNWGKAKTVVTMVAIGFLLLVPVFSYSFITMFTVFMSAFVVFAIATVLTVISGINYFYKNKDVFKKEKDLHTDKEGEDNYDERQS